MRPFALLAALAALSFSSHALAAQSTSTSTAKPSMSQTTSTHAKQDTTKSTASAKASSTKSMSTHHAAWTKAQIKEAQEGLAKAGLYKGKATGTFNADTRKALRAYQKQNNMPATGRLSDSVLVKLKSA
jgi:peptidoglycan hydrolase-like protein with peptidoglycan-binding domain